MDSDQEEKSIELLIPFGSRADYAILKPIIDRINFGKIHHLRGGEFLANYVDIENLIRLEEFKWVLITGDRIESLAAACAAFHNGCKIIHYHAGELNTITTLDDINRHIITLWSDIQLCTSEEAKFNIEQLCLVLRKEPNAHVVGTTLLDDLIVSYAAVPEQEYNVILYNPTTLFKERINFFIGPNEDVRWISNLPREQYLGLVSKARLFVSNSSSSVYEAPWLLDHNQIKQIGQRNKNRTKPDFTSGAATKIKRLLKRVIK